MVCIMSLLVLDMRSIHPIILQLVSPQIWRLPSLCHNSAGFVLPHSWWWGAESCWLPTDLHHPVSVSV